MVLAGLVPAARRVAPEAPKALARAFARLSWPAYAVLVATGIWNVLADHPSGTAWQVVLGVKLSLVATAGLAALLHTRATSRRGLAIWGSVAGTTSVAALVLGVWLVG